MGIPVLPPIDPDPVAPGTGCTRCWGSGKPFGDIDTPSKIIISISGVEPGAAPIPAGAPRPDGEFLLNQTGGDACTYTLVTGGVVLIVQFLAGTTTFSWNHPATGTSWIASKLSECELKLNGQTSGTWINGTAYITLPETT